MMNGIFLVLVNEYVTFCFRSNENKRKNYNEAERRTQKMWKHEKKTYNNL